MNNIIKKSGSIFEAIKHVDELGEYWLARELMGALGYTNWRSFRDVICRGKISVEKAGIGVENHFEDMLKVVLVGYNNSTEQEIADVRLTRYACYIIAQNGNSAKKPRIAEAQTYFAVQTRRQELSDQYHRDMARLARRQEYSESDKRLSTSIMEAGVSARGLATIKNEGDKSFFGGKSNKSMKSTLGTGDKPWANRAHNVVLAGKTLANEMTTSSIENRGVSTYPDILDNNSGNNRAVRQTILEQQGMAPEEFAAAEDTEKIKKRVQHSDNKLLEL